MKEDFIKTIQKDIQTAYLKIPSSMPIILDKEQCKEIFKGSKGKENDITNSEEDDPYLSEESFIGNLSSDNEKKLSKNELKSRIKKTNISIDINSGKTIESLFISRVDRDIFDLKYHSNLETNKIFDFSEFNIISFDKEYNLFLQNFKIQSEYLKRYKEIYDYLKVLKLETKGEFDFIINDVLVSDIISIINNKNKQTFVFGDEKIFTEEKYTIYGEITIDLFKPTNYERKLKQLLKYIIIIKLLDEHSSYFSQKGIEKKNRAIMLVTNGNYIDMIKSIEASKIFSEEYKCEERYDSSSIDKIIKTDKFKANIDEFNSNLSSIGLNLSQLKDECIDFIDETKNYSEFKSKIENFSTYPSYLNKYNYLKDKTYTILKVLKNSKIPFILAYLPNWFRNSLLPF